MNRLPKDSCSGCMLCSAICSKHCIEMIKDSEGFWYPQINLQECIHCGKCERFCPVNNDLDDNASIKSFAAYALNNNIRMSGSSGGVFYCLAESILEEHGVVCAAAFEEDYNSVKHICVETKEALEQLKGSKYVQSNISEVYIAIKNYLNAKKKVLFVGTPCEVAAIKRFFSTEHDFLITVDIICHGVPSELVWTKYLESVHRGKRITSVSMRNKQYGWKNFAMKVAYDKHPQYVRSLAFDLYLRGFLENLYLRKSCYQCHFKSEDRIGDITIADFWGKETNDDKGISLISINTNCGQQLFDITKNKLSYEECDWQQSISKNIAATESAKMNLKRRTFFSEMSENDDFVKSVKKCLSKRSIKDNLYYFYQLTKKRGGNK